jgi:tetratricopeptide (TPR) repeat protein
MNFRIGITATSALVTAFLLSGVEASAKNMTESFDNKHKACLEQIAKDADLAYENAMIWRAEGGGRRARHCEAMALFAVDQTEEAAHRLNQIAKAPDGGTPQMRADFYAEAANFWLIAKLPKEAYASASAGLELVKSHIDLRIARARAYALMGHYDYAETDLTSVLVFDDNHPHALRYRADVRRQLGKLEAAKLDIEKSLKADPSLVETALIRGQINEALRKAAAGTP